MVFGWSTLKPLTETLLNQSHETAAELIDIVLIHIYSIISQENYTDNSNRRYINAQYIIGFTVLLNDNVQTCIV